MAAHIAPFGQATQAGPAASGHRRFPRPSPGLCVSAALHAGAAAAVMLLMRPASELAFGAPAQRQIEVAVAFHSAPPPVPAPMPQAMPVPELPPEPEPPPIVAETPVERPLPQQPEAPVQLAVRPPDPPPKVEEEKPLEPPPPKPVKPAAKPRPKPRAAARPEPGPEPAPEPVPAAQGAPRPVSEPQQAAAPPGAPAPGQASTPAVDRVAAPVPDAGPVVVMNPDYREPPQPPVYPPRSVMLGQQGRVLVRAAIDAEGVPESVAVWESSGHPLLDSAAVTAVKRWRFVPARRGGVPVAALVQVPVNFRLK